MSTQAYTWMILTTSISGSSGPKLHCGTDLNILFEWENVVAFTVGCNFDCWNNQRNQSHSLLVGHTHKISNIKQNCSSFSLNW